MKIDISPEIIFQTARSGGKGGQNVNKVETMVEGRWAVAESALVSEEQKKTITKQLAARITAEGYLLVKSQQDRTQQGNKALVIAKMNELVSAALKPVKKRRPTKMPAAVKQKMREYKQQQSAIKTQRRKLRPGGY